MKEDELRKLATCCMCKRKIGQTNNPMFYTIKIESFIIDMRALQRQQGLAMQLNGNGLLASMMGPNEDMAKRLNSFPKVMVCLDCATSDATMLTAMEGESEENDEQ